MSIHVRRTFQLVSAWSRIAPQPALSRLKSVDAINALLMARCSHATPKDACSLSISNADSTLRIFKEQQPFLKGRPERLTTSAQVCSRRTTEVWWRMTGSNRRPPACKAGALPAELIPRMRQSIQDLDPACHALVSWWVWLDSNQRPPPYQDGALTD